MAIALNGWGLRYQLRVGGLSKYQARIKARGRR